MIYAALFYDRNIECEMHSSKSSLSPPRSWVGFSMLTRDSSAKSGNSVGWDMP